MQVWGIYIGTYLRCTMLSHTHTNIWWFYVCVTFFISSRVGLGGTPNDLIWWFVHPALYVVPALMQGWYTCTWCQRHAVLKQMQWNHYAVLGNSENFPTGYHPCPPKRKNSCAFVRRLIRSAYFILFYYFKFEMLYVVLPPTRRMRAWCEGLHTSSLSNNMMCC